jgi:general stress protein YciG
MSKTEAGRLGGKATFAKHGKKHMRKIGREGARVTWELYSMKPIGQSQYAMVRKSDNIIVAITNRWEM